jgi:type 1 glutamine amidotransferase
MRLFCGSSLCLLAGGFLACASPASSGGPAVAGKDAAVALPMTDAAGPVTAGPDTAPSQQTPVPPADTAPAVAVDAAGAADLSPAIPPGPQSVLIFTRATAVVHVSSPAAAKAMTDALRAEQITADVTADPKVFTPDGLRRYAAVVLLDNTGKPLGDPGTEAIDALAAFVRDGGALVGIHAASSTLYDPALAYTPLIGGKFIDHPGGIRPDACHAVGTHPAVAMLPAPYMVRDEIYSMDHLRPENEVILTCDRLGGGAPLPIAWHRLEGKGRVFYTALGHDASEWAADGPLLAHHVLPGILWALGR